MSQTSSRPIRYLSTFARWVRGLNLDFNPQEGRWWADVLRAVAPFAIVAVAWKGFLWFGHKPAPQTKAAAAAKGDAVEVVTLEPFSEPIEIRVEGVAKPYRYITLAAEVPGRVKYKAPECQEASFVKAGTLLLEIDPTDYELSIKELENQLKQSNLSLDEWQVEKSNTQEQIKLAAIDLELAQRELKRLEPLEAQKIATGSEIDQVKRAEVTAKNTLLSAENRLRTLNAQYDRTVAQRDLQEVKLAKAKRDLERTKIFAPCDATIVSEDVEQDGFVQVGAKLAMLNDTRLTEVQCNLELEDMFWVWGGKSLDAAALDAVSGDATQAYRFPETPVTVEFRLKDMICRWDGKLVRFSGTGLDLVTRTIPCQITVDKPREGKLSTLSGEPVSLISPPPLTVGMFVTVVARVQPRLELFSIPAHALRPGERVWMSVDKRLHSEPVEVARRLKDRVLIAAKSDGVQAGSKVIISPLATAQEGMLLAERTQP